jgi:hypothetical protein
MINAKLREVSTLPASEAGELLENAPEADE